MNSIASPQKYSDPLVKAKSTVLVVDDTPDNLTLMSSLLNESYQVKIANGGKRALKIAMSDTPPDLILLDIMMPNMDGYEVCEQLKLNPKTANIPVIFLTAKAEIADEQKGLELGAVDYITKPISPPIVLARVKNHLALQDQNKALKNAIFIAERANLAKSDFLSSMSHELRSPLNAILGFAQLMESDTPAPTQSHKESISHILHAGWHLLKLINEILDLAKIEQGQISLTQECVSLAEIFTECHSIIGQQALQRDIKLNFPMFPTPLFVRSDRTRLKQILINLLSNAVKYNTKFGTVEVTCILRSPARIRISITDTGKGLNQDQLAQLFQPFNRLGQESSTEEGTGIGLVVTKRLVELMGGLIGVESTVGKGSVFWFELDLISVPSFPLKENNSSALTKQNSSPVTRARTLLYVEDDPANMKLVEQIIARQPEINLLTAVNGKTGIEIARASRPNVILLDINLPDINGFAVMKILQSEPTTEHIPVIAVSANAMLPDIEKALKAGFFQYISKPIRVGELTNAIDIALEFSETMQINTPDQFQPT
jgi:signal transduction histidine kinase